MAVFLFVTAAVALLAGLVGLVARHVPRTTGRQEDEGASRAEGHAPPTRTMEWHVGLT